LGGGGELIFELREVILQGVYIIEGGFDMKGLE
jgi:hypothetical protein